MNALKIFGVLFVLLGVGSCAFIFDRNGVPEIGLSLKDGVRYIGLLICVGFLMIGIERFNSRWAVRTPPAPKQPKMPKPAAAPKMQMPPSLGVQQEMKLEPPKPTQPVSVAKPPAPFMGQSSPAAKPKGGGLFGGKIKIGKK